MEVRLAVVRANAASGSRSSLGAKRRNPCGNFVFLLVQCQNVITVFDEEGFNLIGADAFGHEMSIPDTGHVILDGMHDQYWAPHAM